MDKTKMDFIISTYWRTQRSAMIKFLDWCSHRCCLKNDLKSAVVAQEKLVIIAPNLRHYTDLGELQAATGQLTEAIESYTQALKFTDRKRSDLYYARAVLYARVGMHEQALMDIQEVNRYYALEYKAGRFLSKVDSLTFDKVLKEASDQSR